MHCPRKPEAVMFVKKTMILVSVINGADTSTPPYGNGSTIGEGNTGDKIGNRRHGPTPGLASLL